MADTKKEISPPEWLNKTLVESALKKGLKDDHLKLLEFNIKPAVAIGENYLSCMFRVKLKIQSQKGTFDKSIIIKSLPQKQYLREAAQKGSLFSKEGRMLLETLPKIHDILSKAGDYPVTCPRSYYLQEPPNELIIMEDLCELGFQIANRFEGLTLDQCLLVLESLATYHAGSMALLKNEPDLKEELRENFWGRHRESDTRKMYATSFAAILERTKLWSWENYSEKLQKLESQYVDRVLEAVGTNDEGNGINVIIHGDMWTNNMMFKFSEDGKPTSVKFVDFQLSCYSNPVHDLLYFIFVSPKNEVKIQCLEKMLRAYHTRLMSVCRALNVDICYTFADMQQEFKKRLMFGIAAAFVVFPITCASQDDASKIGETSETTPAQLREFEGLSNERFKRGLLDILKYAEENGVF